MSESPQTPLQSCPVCDYPLAPLASPVCSECGVDPVREVQAALTWYRGSRIWLGVAAGLAALLIVATCARATSRAIGPAVTFQVMLCIASFGLLHAYGTPAYRAAKFRGTLNRLAIAPILLPLWTACVWSAFGVRFLSAATPYAIEEANALLGVIWDIGAGVLVLALIATVTYCTIRRALVWWSWSWAAVAASLALLCLLSAVATVFIAIMLIGGDGMGP